MKRTLKRDVVKRYDTIKKKLDVREKLCSNISIRFLIASVA